jgi:hypothetical protein
LAMEGKTMTEELQRKAIAEACGWKFIPEYYHGKDQPPEFTTVTPDGRHLCGYYPDYLNDLNAMHEAEKVFTDTQWEEYGDYLETMINPVKGWLHATAVQRAEAFLKTIGKWEEKQ